MLQMAGNGIVLEIWTIQKLDGTSGLQYIFTRQVLEAKENKKWSGHAENIMFVFSDFFTSGS